MGDPAYLGIVFCEVTAFSRLGINELNIVDNHNGCKGKTQPFDQFFFISCFCSLLPYITVLHRTLFCTMVRFS